MLDMTQPFFGVGNTVREDAKFLLQEQDQQIEELAAMRKIIEAAIVGKEIEFRLHGEWVPAMFIRSFWDSSFYRIKE